MADKNKPAGAGLSQTIPLDIRRDLRSLQNQLNTVQSDTETNTSTLKTKFGPEDAKQIASIARNGITPSATNDKSNLLDLTGLPGLTNANRIQGIPVTTKPPTNGQKLTYNAAKNLIEWV